MSSMPDYSRLEETAETSARPNLLRRVRKYGRHDYERFDHLASNSACVGYGSIDKVKVNCRFRFTQSQWGVLGHAGNPAGIIYLDLEFDQPSDCRLESAVVLVTLEEVSALSSTSKEPLPHPVQFTEYYGPKHIHGEQREVQIKDKRYLRPHGEAFGFGGDLFGVEKETTKRVTGRWMFSGHLVPGKGRHWAYKTLKWELKENPLESQAGHANIIHTAFAFEHNGDRFKMTVNIKGTLMNWADRVKQKMRFGRDENSTATMVHFSEQYSFRRPLDELARGLHFAMEAENMAEVPAEISDTMSVSFQQEAPPQPTPLSAIQATRFSAQQPMTAVQVLRWQQREKRLRSTMVEQPQALLPEPEDECSLDDIARAAGLTAPPMPTQKEPARKLPSDQSTSLSSSTTIVNSQVEMELGQSRGRGKDASVNILRLVEIPFILAFLHLLRSLLGYQRKQRDRVRILGLPKQESEDCISLKQEDEELQSQLQAFGLRPPAPLVKTLPKTGSDTSVPSSPISNVLPETVEYNR